MAKITITTSVNKFSKVLENLKLTKDFSNDVEFTVDLEILDCKENFEYLSKSDDIKSWDFYKEIPEITRLEVDSLPKERTVELTNTSEVSIFNLLNNTAFKEDISGNYLKLIKISWDLSRKGFRFTVPNIQSRMIFGKLIDDDLIYKDESMVRLLIENYYSDTDFEEALEHLIFVIKTNWTNIKSCDNLTKVVTILFNL